MQLVIGRPCLYCRFDLIPIQGHMGGSHLPTKSVCFSYFVYPHQILRYLKNSLNVFNVCKFCDWNKYTYIYIYIHTYTHTVSTMSSLTRCHNLKEKNHRWTAQNVPDHSFNTEGNSPTQQTPIVRFLTIDRAHLDRSYRLFCIYTNIYIYCFLSLSFSFVRTCCILILLGVVLDFFFPSDAVIFSVFLWTSLALPSWPV